MSRLSRPTELHHAIVQVIQQRTPAKPDNQARDCTNIRITSSRNVAGGCISQTEIVTLADGRKFFVKSNELTAELFPAESKGLAAIESTQVIRVPQVIGVGKSKSGVGFLVLESIETGRPGNEFESQFGRAMAKMHLHGRNDRFGFNSDNHIGSSIQLNHWMANWVEFWAINRLGYQLSLASENGYATPEFTRRCDLIIARLDTLIGTDEKPSLIHGDLWSGNFMVSSDGEPVLIDPAVYFGSREAEFGMTTLFGGFGSRFYDAYAACWPLPNGWQERVEVYRLYHLMNHLNLFGPGYLSQCMEILKKYS